MNRNVGEVGSRNELGKRRAKRAESESDGEKRSDRGRQKKRGWRRRRLDLQELFQERNRAIPRSAPLPSFGTEKS